MSATFPTSPARPAAASDAIDFKRVKAIFVGSIGNLVEWYDFYCYAAFSLYFSSAFFPSSDPVAQSMSTAAIFALGFFVRPIGGLLFGYIGDRHGRRLALMLSVLLMCAGSLLIACAPTYASVGVWAPAILLMARLLQGLSLGGEYGSSATYLSEMATSKHRGFYASFQYVTLIGGQLAALVVLLVLQNFVLDTAELKAWGWRIPFFIGAGLAIVALIMRSDLPETQAFQAEKQRSKDRMGGFKLLMQHPRECLIVIGLTMGGTLAFYVYTTYMQKFLVNTAGFSKGQASEISAISLIGFLLAQPLAGWLSDKVGRKPMLIAAFGGGALAIWPIMTGISQATTVAGALSLILVGVAIQSCYTSISAVVKAELFPAHIRALGVALPYALANVLFGGTAEMVALAFKHEGIESAFYVYVAGVMTLGLVCAIILKDTGRHSLIHED